MTWALSLLSILSSPRLCSQCGPFVSCRPNPTVSTLNTVISTIITWKNTSIAAIFLDAYITHLFRLVAWRNTWIIQRDRLCLLPIDTTSFTYHTNTQKHNHRRPSITVGRSGICPVLPMRSSHGVCEVDYLVSRACGGYDTWIRAISRQEGILLALYV